MPMNYETKTDEYYNHPNENLRSYLQRVREGQPDEYRTTLFKGKSISTVMDNWLNQLEVIRDEWPTLWEFELDLANKVGPMSIMKPLEERMDDIESYYDSISLESKPISESAISAVISEWSKVRGLRMRSVERTLEKMKKSTSGGLPYFQKRNLLIDKSVPFSIERIGKDTLMHLPNGSYKTAAVLGWRGQEGGRSKADVKQRVVWMFPFVINIAELQVYQTMIESAQKFNLVPAWVSMDQVSVNITRLFDTKGKDDLIICTDFKKFDQHFNAACQLAASQILERLFTPSAEFVNWLRDVYPIKYDIPLMIQMDRIITGAHGMASGSGGTNADETLLHRALQYEAAINNNSTLNPNSQCLGDDGIISYPGCTVEDVTSAYTAHGLVMQPEKQLADEQYLTYLRRWHHTKYRQNGVCVGVYSTCRALGRLLSQERYYDPEVWGPKAIALRQLSILENVRYHPENEKFVEFCMKGDKFRLGIDIPGFLSNIDQEAKKVIEYMPDFLGYTKSLQKGTDHGISKWWIVKYLKSRA